MTTIEEELADHTWPCEMCTGTVYSIGFLGDKEHGSCRQCGMLQWREDDTGLSTGTSATDSLESGS